LKVKQVTTAPGDTSEIQREILQREILQMQLQLQQLQQQQATAGLSTPKDAKKRSWPPEEETTDARQPVQRFCSSLPPLGYNVPLSSYISQQVVYYSEP